VIINIIENDVPRSIGDKIAEFLARPPQPILRFYGAHSWEGSTFKFQVRNGLPLPLLYGVYVGSDGNYREATDHIGPFGTDCWSVTFDEKPLQVSIKLGLVPFEIQTDRLEVADA